MIKKKLAAFAAATLAACSIGATVFAAGVYPIAKSTLVEGSTGITVQPRMKDDNLYAVAYVDSGLESGSTYLTFRVIDNETGAYATGEEELWVNSRCVLDYKSGYGIIGDYYRLQVHMPPQANAHSITFEGSWTP